MPANQRPADRTPPRAAPPATTPGLVTAPSTTAPFSGALPSRAPSTRVLSTGTTIQAPPAAVLRALRQTELYSRTARALGRRLEVAGEPVDVRRALRPGDVLRVRPAGRAGVLRPPTTLLRVRSTHPTPELEILAGRSGGGTITFTVDEFPADEAPTSLPGEPAATVRVLVDTPGRRSLRSARRVRAASAMLLGIATLLAREPLVVVAGVVVDGGRVLAARRAAPSAHAGGWEFPGGKVEPGETERAALARELQEELGITVRVGDRVGPEVDLGDLTLLRFRAAAVEAGSPTPRAGHHDEVRRLAADELDDVEWLAADRAVLPAVRALLTPGPG